MLEHENIIVGKMSTWYLKIQMTYVSLKNCCNVALFRYKNVLNFMIFFIFLMKKSKKIVFRFLK